MDAGRESSGSTRPRDRQWLYALGAGLLFGAALFVIPDRGWVWILVASAMLVASPIFVVVALIRHRPSARRGWYLVVAGLSLNATATLIWYPSQAGSGSLPFPSIADALFLAGYAAVLIGVSSLVYARSSEFRTGIFDALIVAIGAGIVSWGFLIGPIMDETSLPGKAKAVSVAYPLLDLLMLAVAARLAFDARRSPASKLLGCYLLVQLGADSIFSYSILGGTFSTASPVFALWGIAQGLIAAAALHPSMRSLAEPPSTRRTTLSKLRAWAIALAAISGPAAIIAKPTLDDARILSIAALGVFCLVIFRLSGLIVDIDQYRRIQKDLRTAEAKYRALVEKAPIIVYEWEFGDPGRWRYVSPQIKALLGYDAQEYMDAPELWFSQVHEDDREKVLASEAISQATVESQIVEYRMRHRAGNLVWIRDDAVVARDEDGEPYFRGILSDITLEKEAEHALESANVELERRVIERTQALHVVNQDLRKAIDEAEQASQAKSEFLSRASHELRTPLNAILGFGQLLEMSSLSDRDTERLGHILKGGRHLLRLINEVLDVSKMQAGSLSLSLEPVSVDEAVGHAIAKYTAATDLRGIELVTARATSHDFVLADRQRLLQILSELLSNAIRFSERGGIVAIDWNSDSAGTSIRVTDTGQGISPEDLPRIWDLFGRGDAPSSGREEGTGLGLALARGLVEAMGGTITAESEVGVGTTMSLKLLPSTAHVFDGSTTDPLIDGAGSMRDLTMLYVEDNPANVALIQEIVASRPRINLLQASLGEVGLKIAHDHNPDLVLLDLHLPDMSGEDALSHLKNDPATAHIPVLVVSAETDRSRIQRLEELGSAGFVAKPVDIPSFLALIDATLKIEAPSPVP